jgi:hypothetical protein
MADKLFVFGVANVWGYDENENIIFQSKTLADSSITAAVQVVDIRGGQGNFLEARYFHSPELSLTLNDTQWNLNFLSNTTGGSITTGKNVFDEETVVLAAGKAGAVLGTPLAMTGTPIYGWVVLADGTEEKVEFTGKDFVLTGAGATEGSSVTVRYYALDAAARSMTITNNFVPKIIRLVMEAQLFSSDTASNKVGTVLIEFPRVQLSGGFTVSLASDGVSSTPMEAMALSYTPAGSTQGVFGYITQRITNSTWSSNVKALAIEGGDFGLTVGQTKQLVVYAIPNDGGAAFRVPKYADLTFASSDAAKATVSAAGLVAFAGAGPTTVKVSITAKNTIDANVVVTCS